MSQHDSNQRKTGLSRKLKALLPVLLALLGGCVYSVQPWYAEGTGGVDHSLTGIWREVDGEDCWVFIAKGDSLRLIYQEDNQSGEFTALSFQVGGQHFLDLTPAAGEVASGPVGWYLLPLHGLHTWSIDQDTLRMSSLNIQALEALLPAIEHPPLEKQDNRTIFLGEREAMAAFVEQALLDPSLYDEATVLVRQ